MQKIVPHFWFDKEAEEAAEFYVGVFKDSRIIGLSHYPDAGQEAHHQPAGSVMNVEFEIAGFRFLSINAGPVFKPNPSISFLLNFSPSVIASDDTAMDECWSALAEGGQVLMDLGEYPFSPKYGWVQDRFGISWQLMSTGPDGEDRPFIAPQLMFSGHNANRAQEAIEMYTSTFDNSRTGNLVQYPEATGDVKAGSLMFGDFQLDNIWFAAMDSPITHEFNFNEGISLVVNCENQEEIDRYWSKLSAVPEAEQCGWCKDIFGVSWQIVPADIVAVMGSEDPEKMQRNFAAMMQMKKIELAKFE